MSTARLFVLSGRQLGTDHLLEGPSVLGRGDDATVRLRDPSVSRAHARLSPEAEGWRLVDLGSSNGCFVGGERVETALLRDREEFRLGTLELRLRIEAAPPSTGAAPEAAAVAPPAEPAPAPAATEPELATSTSPREEPAVPDEPAAASSDEGEIDLELELEGDWDEEAAPVPVRAPATPQPAPQPAPAAPERAPVGSAAPDLAGRPVLRSQQEAARGGLLSSDLAQQSAPVRWLLYLLAIGLFVGLVWGSYRLVFGVRQARDVPAPEAYE